MNRRIALTSFAASMMAMVSMPAMADNTQWSSTASACHTHAAPASYTEFDNQINVVAGEQVFMNCPINHPMVGTPTKIRIYGFGASGTAGRITATLYRVSKATGSTVAVGTVSRQANFYASTTSAAFSTTFDFDNFWFYVQLRGDAAFGGSSAVYLYAAELVI